MDGFLSAVDPLQRAKIIIDGEPVIVDRCRLLDHLRLSEIELKIANSKKPVPISAAVIEYLFVAGLTDNQIKNASGYELLEAFFVLRKLNAWKWLPPWLKNQEKDEGPGVVYDYKGRRWAIWIHKLASRYGWTPDAIWNLYPEEVAVYMQEVMVAEYYEREDRRALSEVSYKYDKVTKTSRFIPSPLYSWMVDNKPPEVVRVPVRALPVGNVIKLDN